MKVTIRVGAVSVVVDGMEMTRRQVRALLMDAAGVAAVVKTEPPPPEPDTPLGFTAHLERLPDDFPSAD